MRGRQSDVARCTMCGAAAQSSASWATAATASRKVYSGVVIAGRIGGGHTTTFHCHVAMWTYAHTTAARTLK